MEAEFNTNLTSLRLDTSSDLAAIAYVDHTKRQIHWKYISGNRNKKYKMMKTKPGSDLSGLVVRSGDLIMVDESTSDLTQKRKEFPIMLAEDLYSAMATPIIIEEKIMAVLLIGSRMKRTYTKNEVKLVIEKSKIISSFIKEELAC